MAAYQFPSSPPVAQKYADNELSPSCPPSPASATTRSSPLSDRYKQKHPMLSGPNHIEGMKEFMNKHLQDILKPFASEIAQAHENINDMNTQMAKVVTKLENNTLADKARQEVLNRLEASVESTNSKVEFSSAKMDGELQNIRQERAAIASQVQASAKDVRELRIAHQKAQAHNDTEQQNHSKGIDKLQTELEDFKESNLQVVRALQNQVANLEKAHQFAAEMFDQKEKMRMRDHTDLRTLMENARTRWQQDKEKDELMSRTVSRLDTSVSKIEERLKDLGADRVTHAIGCVETLMRQMSATSRAQTVLESQQKMTDTGVQGLKDSILKHNQILGASADSAKYAKNLIQTVSLMREQMITNDAKVQDLSEHRVKINNDLSDRTARIGVLEELDTKFKGAMDKQQLEVDRKLQAMANSIDQNDHSKRITKVEQAREADKADFLARAQRQEEENHKMFVLQEQLREGAKAADDKLHRLQVSMTDSVNEMAVLRGGMETTSDYWNGLTQGMEKVHQNVSMDGGILSARYPRKLPALNLD